MQDRMIYSKQTCIMVCQADMSNDAHYGSGKNGLDKWKCAAALALLLLRCQGEVNREASVGKTCLHTTIMFCSNTFLWPLQQFPDRKRSTGAQNLEGTGNYAASHRWM